MAARLGFKLVFLVATLQVHAQLDSVGLRLKEIQNKVILDFSEPVSQKIHEYIFNSPENSKKILERFFLHFQVQAFVSHRIWKLFFLHFPV